MSAQHFSTGKQFRWQGELYEVKRLLPNGEINIEVVKTGATVVKPIREIVEALFGGELFFVVIKRNSTGLVEEKIGAGKELDDYLPHLVKIARYRLEVIKPLVALRSAERTLAVVKARVEAIMVTLPPLDAASQRTLQEKLSWRSAYRWLQSYIGSGNDLRALIPNTLKRGGKNKSRLATDLNVLMDVVIREQYYRPEKVVIPTLHQIIAARVEEENQLRPANDKLPIPALSTVNRRVAALDMREKFAARHGNRATKRKFKQLGKTDYPEVPLERVEIDHTQIDVIVVDEVTGLALGRLTLTYALDMCTRYPLGYYIGFEPASYYAVMECLYHCIRPKADTRKKYNTEHLWLAYGMPALLVPDQGREFVGDDLSDSAEQLGFIVQHAPVRTPEFKGGIERAIRSANLFYQSIPGTTFSNPIQRGDYDSGNQACITLQELEQVTNIFIVDIYAMRKHAGLGCPPALAWQQAMQAGFSPRVPASAQELEILLGRVIYRTVQRYGIEFENLRYNAPELGYLRNQLKPGTQVKVKYHPGDLSQVHVFNPYAKEGENPYITAPALEQDYARGKSLWAHQVICRCAHETEGSVDLAALGRAVLKIQALVETARKRKRGLIGRRIGRWLESGNAPSVVERKAQAPAKPSAPPALPAPAASLPAAEAPASPVTSTPTESTPAPTPPAPPPVLNTGGYTFDYFDPTDPKS